MNKLRAKVTPENMVLVFGTELESFESFEDSGATIEANPEGNGSWILHFEGYDTSDGRAESHLVVYFILAVDLETLEMTLDNSKAIDAAINNWTSPPFLTKEDKEKLRRFIYDHLFNA